MGDGYGSECHLLRFLGRHRTRFDAAVRSATGASEVEWLDYPFDASKAWGDGEWTGLDFLPKESLARAAWSDFWPQRGNPPNWDAVGRVRMCDASEWLLVEAKAHLAELRSSCQASEHGGLPKIRAALSRTKQALGIGEDADWVNGYYQHANRLAVLNFLNGHGEPARLLFAYFCGDRFPGGNFDCPDGAAGWEAALSAQDEHLGINVGHVLADRIHKMFVSVTDH